MMPNLPSSLIGTTVITTVPRRDKPIQAEIHGIMWPALLLKPKSWCETKDGQPIEFLIRHCLSVEVAEDTF